MKKKIFTFGALLLVSSLALAAQKNGVVQFVNDYAVSSPQPNHIVYFSPEQSPAGEWTFRVNKTRQIHNKGLQSDTMTVSCNGIITLIKAGQTGTCKLTNGKV